MTVAVGVAGLALAAQVAVLAVLLAPAVGRAPAPVLPAARLVVRAAVQAALEPVLPLVVDVVEVVVLHAGRVVAAVVATGAQVPVLVNNCGGNVHDFT